MIRLKRVYDAPKPDDGVRYLVERKWPPALSCGAGLATIRTSSWNFSNAASVIEGAQKLLVSFPDGRSFPAKLVGRDPLSDLAVIKIEGDNLPVATLGDWVVAIENALALNDKPTVSTGVVSALGRTL